MPGKVRAEEQQRVGVALPQQQQPRLTNVLLLQLRYGEEDDV